MFTSSTGRLHPVWAFVVSAVFSVLAFLVAAYAAGGIAGDRILLFEVIFRPLLALLLIALFVWLLAVADHIEDHRIAALGLPRAKGWLKQFVTGCLLGFVLTVLAMVPIAIWGHISLGFRLSRHTLPRVGAVLLITHPGRTRGRELIFRGYPFQHLEQGIGAIGAITVFSVMFGTVHLANPGASTFGIDQHVPDRVLLSIAYLRTRAFCGYRVGHPFRLEFSAWIPLRPAGKRSANL